MFEIFLIGGHIKVPVPAGIEQNDLRFTGFLAFQSRVHRCFGCVRGFRRQNMAFGTGKTDRRVETGVLMIRSRLNDVQFKQVAYNWRHPVIS